MSKEFKEFDRKYKHLAGTAIKNIRGVGGSIAKEDIFGFKTTGWPFWDQFTEAYSAGEINFAVYKATGAEEWQKFRVSLKGLTTCEKLYALTWYWYTHVECGVSGHITAENLRHEVIRVNNYLGALKRGGQLNSALKVVRD